MNEGNGPARPSARSSAARRGRPGLPRPRARAPLSRTHPIRPAQAETGRPLARPRRARALPFLHVPRVQFGDPWLAFKATRVPGWWQGGFGLRPAERAVRALRSVENLRTGQFPVVFDLNLLAAALCLRNAGLRLPTAAARLGSVRLLIVASGVLQPGGWGRYVLPAFPVFLAWALALEGRLALAGRHGLDAAAGAPHDPLHPLVLGGLSAVIGTPGRPEAGDAGRPARASERSPGRSGTGSRSGRQG